MLRIGRLFHTVRHLRAGQVAWRLWYRALPARVRSLPALPRRRAAHRWESPVWRPASMLARNRFRFLNVEHEIAAASDWNHPRRPKLWLYNLHYFDDLNAVDAERRRDWHEALIADWIAANPPCRGNGWEPYTLSLRIVNWIKWALRGNALSPAAMASLATQAGALSARPEYHLLGNHLLANAKALVFAGLFFDGARARRWYAQGKRILDAQLREQVLADGAHFELSPMYHAIVLEDLLDVVALHGCFAREAPSHWSEPVRRMLRWLRAMQHPDGDIALFNDAAFGNAAGLTSLEAYAAGLGIVEPEDDGGAVRDLAASGYVRVDKAGATAILDLGPVGPDYLPAHAHADTLSFELSLAGQRVFVNCGTSQYQAGPRRRWERGTAAHNTLGIDAEDSSETWGGFRVARRARVFDRRVTNADGRVRVSASHDGYRRLPGRPVHSRSWEFSDAGMQIRDRVEGSGRHSVAARLHLHPSCLAVGGGESNVVLVKRGSQALCRVEFQGFDSVCIEENLFAPEFGRLVPTRTLCAKREDVSPPLDLGTWIEWAPGAGGG